MMIVNYFVSDCGGEEDNGVSDDNDVYQSINQYNKNGQGSSNVLLFGISHLFCYFIYFLFLIKFNFIYNYLIFLFLFVKNFFYYNH